MSDETYYQAGTKIAEAVELLQKHPAKLTERELNVVLSKVAPTVRGRCHLRDRLRDRGFLQSTKTFELTPKGVAAKPVEILSYGKEARPADTAPPTDAVVKLGRWMMNRSAA